MIEGNLIKVGCYNFLAELMSFCTQKRYSESCQSSDKRLKDGVRVGAAVGIRRLYLAEGRRDDQQPLRVQNSSLSLSSKQGCVRALQLHHASLPCVGRAMIRSDLHLDTRRVMIPE